MLKAFLRNVLITAVIALAIFALSGHMVFAGLVGFLTFAAMYGI